MFDTHELSVSNHSLLSSRSNAISHHITTKYQKLSALRTACEIAYSLYAIALSETTT